MIDQFISLDVPPLLSAVFASATCGLLGSFLVLRRLSLMGDTISHSVLPGIVIAFLLTSSRASIPVFIGASIAAILSAVLVQFVTRYGKVEAGASMGVVFSLFFALGILLMEQAAARNVDLDASCLLHGQLETIFWFPPESGLISLEAMRLLPVEVYSTAAVLFLSVLFVILFYKELQISSFDPDLSTSLGFSSSKLHYALMILVAASVVASFKVVGSILVIAMIICPAAIARLLTDSLKTQLILSALLGGLLAISGYMIASFAPMILGYENSLSASGMIAFLSGFVVLISVIFSPQYGALAKWLRQKRIGREILEEDILALLFRKSEAGVTEIPLEELESVLGYRSDFLKVLSRLVSMQNVIRDQRRLSLTEKGRERAESVVRSHRLWETYLVKEANVRTDHVHAAAEALEHLKSGSIEKELVSASDGVDPHGKKIP